MVPNPGNECRFCRSFAASDDAGVAMVNGRYVHAECYSLYRSNLNAQRQARRIDNRRRRPE